MRNAAGRQPDERRLTVLFVDDDPNLLRMCAALWRQSAVLFTASTPRQARDCLRSLDFDIILIDYKLRGSYGTLLLEEAGRECPGARRVLVSGARPPDADDILRVGLADAFVLKTSLTCENFVSNLAWPS
jgi:response regulator RpfG family c-di-GMP phosphodiesterase